MVKLTTDKREASRGLLRQQSLLSKYSETLVENAKFSYPSPLTCTIT